MNDEHICGVCYLPVGDHDQRCYEGDHVHMHYPALCCDGCPCQVTAEHEHPAQSEEVSC